MKTNDKKALRGLSVEKLKERLAQTYKERADLRIQLGSGKIKNVHAVRQKSREIAVIATLIQEKLEEAKLQNG